MLRMRAIAVLLAGGQGTRVGGAVPKQYLTLAGRALLEHALLRFTVAKLVEDIVMVVPAQEVVMVRERFAHVSPKCVEVVAGGARRQDSMAAGVRAVATRFSSACCEPNTDARREDDIIIAVHDVARPLIRPALIDACITRAANVGACIVAMPARDTIKQVDAAGRIVATLPRTQMWQAQTPQAARLSLLLEAIAHMERTGLEGTDEAALLEAIGARVEVVAGDAWNLKVTAPEDLLIAEALWTRYASSLRGDEAIAASQEMASRSVSQEERGGSQ